MNDKKHTEENENLITSKDLLNLPNLFSFAIKCAGTDRGQLVSLIEYEMKLNSKIQMTLKVIKDKSKPK